MWPPWCGLSPLRPPVRPTPGSLGVDDHSTRPGPFTEGAREETISDITDLLARYPGGYELDVRVRPRHRRGAIRWRIGAPQKRTAHAPGTTPVGPAHTEPEITVQLLDDQQVTLGPITGADDQGNAVPLLGTPSVTVDNPTVATLTDNGDGTFLLATTGVLGTVTVSASDTEPDGTQFQGSVAFDVTTSAVVAIEIPVGTPTTRP